MTGTWEEVILAVMRTRPGRSWHLGAIYSEIERLAIVAPHHREIWGTQPNIITGCEARWRA